MTNKTNKKLQQLDNLIEGLIEELKEDEPMFGTEEDDLIQALENCRSEIGDFINW